MHKITLSLGLLIAGFVSGYAVFSLSADRTGRQVAVEPKSIDSTVESTSQPVADRTSRQAAVEPKPIDSPVESTKPPVFVELLGAWTGESLPASKVISSWPAIFPAVKPLVPINETEAGTSAGIRYASILKRKANGFSLGTFAEPIPCKGASIVVAVRPIRCRGKVPWTSIVDVFYDRLTLGIHNDTGLVCVRVNGLLINSERELPDQQVAILSLVVDPDGAFTVYANGAQIMSGQSDEDMKSLKPCIAGPFANEITIGRNAPDHWTTFNGYIGGVYIYAKALSLVERQQTELQLAKSIPSIPPVERPAPKEVKLELLGTWRGGSLPGSGVISSWPAISPETPSLVPIRESKVETIGGTRYASILKESENGFSLGEFTEPIPCNGASVVVAVRPVRCSGDVPWTSIVDIFYDRLTLGVHNDTGLVCVHVNGQLRRSENELPDQRIAILSLVVEANGKYSVFANGSLIMSGKSDEDMKTLEPGIAGPFANAITIGRNAPDPWTNFNGHIGAVYIYAKALSSAERQQLEVELAQSFKDSTQVESVDPNKGKINF